MTEPNLATDGATSLYRYYDSNDLLLYVGVTARGIARNIEHDRSKEWWQFVARQAVEHYPTRRAALAAEKSIIQAFRPPFNKVHNPDHAAMRDAYLSLREQGRLPNRDAAFRNLKWLPLEFVSYDGSKFLYVTPGAYTHYVDTLDKDRYGFLCALKKGKVSITRERGALWVAIRGTRGRIGAPRLRVHPVSQKSRTHSIKGIDLLGDTAAHPIAARWSAESMKGC